MWTYPGLITLAADLHMDGVAFDQCRTDQKWQKTTFLLATPGLIEAVRQQFEGLVCNHAEGHKTMAGPLRNDGSFQSEDSAEYTADMCMRLSAAVDAYLAPSVPVSAVDTEADPMHDWAAFYDTGDGAPAVIAYVGEVDDDEAPRATTGVDLTDLKPKLQRDTLAAVLANTDASEWRPVFYAAGIDDAVMAMPSNAFVDDKPTFRSAVNGAEKASWFAAMDREHANLTNHDAYAEV